MSNSKTEAGPHELELQETRNMIPFPGQWKENFNRDRYRVFIVQQDSMAPAFNVGDLAVVDTQRTIIADASFLIDTGGGVEVIRRIQNMMGGYVVGCDNPMYRDLTYSPEEFKSQMGIVGMIVWRGGYVG